jgi:hypothetical protein
MFPPGAFDFPIYGVSGGRGIMTGPQLGREKFFIVFLQLVSLWMVTMGVLMWRHARAAQNGEPTPGRNE